MLYESFVHPITILSTLPSAGVGALLALMLFSTEFCIIALIGVILLIGIVQEERDHDDRLRARRRARARDVSPRDAIFEACLLRFRPIMMTTMAALLGALPLALGSGRRRRAAPAARHRDRRRADLSQLLTLYTTPVVYLYLDRFSGCGCASCARRRAAPRRSRAASGGRAAMSAHPSRRRCASSRCRRDRGHRRVHGRARLRAPRRADVRPRTRKRRTAPVAAPRDARCRAARWWEALRRSRARRARSAGRRSTTRRVRAGARRACGQRAGA